MIVSGVGDETRGLEFLSVEPAIFIAHETEWMYSARAVGVSLLRVRVLALFAMSKFRLRI